MVDEPEKIALVLKWTKTWEDRENDFVARSPVHEDSVGRIYLHEHGAQQGEWSWSFTAHGEGIARPKIHNGIAPSPREAAKAVENAWFAAIKDTPLDVAEPQKPSKNSYAAAKGGE